MTTEEQKIQVLALRNKSYCYSEICKELNIPKSTVYTWARTVILSDEQKRIIADKILVSKRAHAKKLVGIKKAYYIKRDLLINKEAIGIVNNIQLTLDQKRLLCSVLYWCEGGKAVEKNGIQFVNSDALMVKKFLSLFREGFGINDEKLHALVHLHEYHDSQEIHEYWSEQTGIPITRFYRPYLKPHTGKNKRLGYKGCISIRYSDVYIGKLLKMIYIEFSKTA